MHLLNKNWYKEKKEDILKKFLQRKFHEYIIKGFFIALYVVVGIVHGNFQVRKKIFQAKITNSLFRNKRFILDQIV